MHRLHQEMVSAMAEKNHPKELKNIEYYHQNNPTQLQGRGFQRGKGYQGGRERSVEEG